MTDSVDEKIYHTRALAWSGGTDSSGKTIVNINRSGHISSDDPTDTSRAKHATAYSVSLVNARANQAYTLAQTASQATPSSASTTQAGISRYASSTEVGNGVVSNAVVTPSALLAALTDPNDNPLKTAAGANTSGGSSGGASDVSVVNTPVIYGKFALIGSATTFTVKASAGLQDSVIDHFKIGLTGCAEQTVTAANDTASVTFTIDSAVEEGSALTLSCIAYDNNGNASKTATAAITATTCAVDAPTVLSPVTGDVIVYNEGFTVTGSEFSLMGTGSDNHSATRVIIRNHTNGNILKTIDFGAVTTCTLTAANLTNLGHGYHYDISLTYQGENLGWGTESIPVTVKLNSALRAPTVIAPVEGSNFYYISSLVVRCAPFTTDFLPDTFVKRTYQLRDALDNVVVTREVTSQDAYNFGDLTGIIGTGAYRLYVKDTGTTFGDSEWTGPIAVTSLPTSLVPAELLSPSDNCKIGLRSGIACKLDASNVSAQISGAEFQICTGADGSGIILTHTVTGVYEYTFPYADIKDILELNSSYYVRGRFLLTSGEATGYGAILFTAKEGYSTPSGRIIYRHPNGRGSVVSYDYFGTPRNIFVGDAAYRKNQDTKWSASQTLVNDLFQFSSWTNVTSDGKNYIYRHKDSNNVPQLVIDDTGTVNCAAEPVIGPVTDDQLNIWLKPLHDNEQKTARECTDIIINAFGKGNAPAAEYCRGLTSLFSDGCDLPLLHDLAVIYIEGDSLDAIDPTLADYPNNNLGIGSSNKRWFTNGRAWSCQQYNSTNALNLHCNSYLNNYNKTNTYSVLPVREI